MKQKNDWDMEFIDLDDDNKDTARIKTQKKKKKSKHSVQLPFVIIMAVIVSAAAVFLLLLLNNHGESEEISVPVMEETEGEGIQESQEPDSAQQTGQELPDIASQEPSETAGEEKSGQEAETTQQTAKDPQTETMGTEQGTEVDVTQLLSSGAVAETEKITIGIDVARYQGTIDWAQVAASGIEFAMVRVGYRTDSTREICADTNARFNMQEAQKNGIKVGAYFFSTATSTQEAQEEADWVADYIAQYQITYPVVYDCEGFDRPESAQYELTKTQRTDIAIAFLDRIYSRGYTPMFYASMSELTGEAKWETSRIDKTYKIWVSQYPAVPYPQTATSSYGGSHAMWQYTNRGTVAGIDKPVDVKALMNFTQVNETVTAKDSTNLRNIPSQGSDSTVVYTLQNGETLTRTGVSDSGWSRLEYNGQKVYAVSSYLTTDLSMQAPEPEAQEGSGSGDGLKTRFEDRNEQVTAKIEVNLRTLPSVTNPDAAVTAVLHNGEYVTRTGINEAYGWSRVDYNGQTLYCITSYLTQ